MPELQINALSKTYPIFERKMGRNVPSGTMVALRDISFQIEKNQFLSLVGPSGCGKTTLLRMVAGILPIEAGEIVLGGEVVHGPSPKIAMVFQNIGLMPWRTALRNVEFALELGAHRRLTEDEREECKRYLRLVGLQGFENYYPHQLSGGMQQRVGLARALVRKPSILLMDEPFGALDAQTRNLLQDQVLRLRQNIGMTTLFVTHDLEEAIYLSDRVVILSKRPGTVKKIIDVNLKNPRYEYDAKADPEFLELRRIAWASLKEELTI